jgi:uncharacterized protein with PIN domain
MRDVKAAPPGNVGASVLVWAEAALKVLTLVRFRTKLVAPQDLSRCPKCGSPDLQRSRVRFYEKPRKALSAARPYRCESCRKRSWGHRPYGHTGYRRSRDSGGRVLQSETALDLSVLDRAFDRR